jgi:hypothetical protein
MKNVLKIMTVVFLASIIIVGCKKVKSLADVTFDQTFTADLDCVVPPAATRDINGTFNASAVIDPASDPDVAEYLNNIVGYEILSVIGTITSVSKDNVNLLSATGSVFNNSSNASWQFTNVPIVVGGTLTFGNENGQWGTVDQILMTGQVFTVSLSGTTDEDDFTFTVEVAIETEITANPL